MGQAEHGTVTCNSSKETDRSVPGAVLISDGLGSSTAFGTPTTMVLHLCISPLLLHGKRILHSWMPQQPQTSAESMETSRGGVGHWSSMLEAQSWVLISEK